MTTNATTARQIGRMNILATSGGRVNALDANTLSLPVRYGYRVEVEYRPGPDLYDVRRVLVRGGRRFDKGEVTGVCGEALGDVVYRAGCYHDPFGVDGAGEG